ncbi:hypothetical protein A0H81_12201 [Grifola frondosa]|uniref:Uncharacterized protein n=1 Tax=Grifola frondosa TaxID=5627 RepID=A0A1C7LSL3_GRIFR|nr:hypothetical protein A0H81_12201 [Grifola frondosa]
MSSTSSSIATSTQSSLGVFESAGGPPLILVCIAVGLLVGVFAGVIIMRRIRPHPVVARRTPDGFFRASEQRFGEKPLLCDLHPNPVAWPEYDGKENRWEKVVVRL